MKILAASYGEWKVQNLFTVMTKELRYDLHPLTLPSPLRGGAEKGEGVRRRKDI